MVAPVLLALALGGAAAAPVADQTLIFYNARLAAREKRPAEVLKLWLLHNTVAINRGERGTYDPDFRSLVWAALGETGVCQDGLALDDEGAGLWPLALHNWLVRNMSQPTPVPRPAPFDAFQVGKQQRQVSLHDVLSASELRSVGFFRGECLLPWMTMINSGISDWPDLKNRIEVAKLMRHLLHRSRSTLVPGKIEHRAAIDARIFDLNLLLARLQERTLRRRLRERRQQSRLLGVAEAPEDSVFVFDPAPDSEEGKILRGSLRWSPQAWLSLAPERRLFLFSHAKKLSGNRAELDRLILSLIDALIERRAGNEVEQWIASLEGAASRREVFLGERGRQLLGLDPDTGFRERAAIALQRGVAALEEGDLREALRSFAYSLSHATDSREPGAIVALSRRWLSYVLSRHHTDEEVIGTLAALVPRHEYNAIIEDLVWRAALTSDLSSFLLCTRGSKRSSAFDARAGRLQPLAAGKLADFGNRLRQDLIEEPFTTLRFIRQLIDRLEAEDADVRRTHAPTFALLIRLLAPLAAPELGGATQARVAAELTSRCVAVLDGLGTLDAALEVEPGARALSPTSDTFAGSIRLAPADPLPWPFSLAEPTAPHAFAQLLLVPLEWRDEQGERVMGWTITE